MIVFCANSLPQVIAGQGLKQFQTITSLLTPHIIINQCGGDIEARSKYFTKYLEKINQPFHLIAYGVAGLDIRYALNQSTNVQAQSLITIGTPHRGSILSKFYRVNKVEDDLIDPLCRILGIRKTVFEELNPQNIQDFNLVVPNKPNIKYFSINAETVIDNMSEIYHPSAAIIENNKEFPVLSGSDGIFAHNETKWGQHIVTFDCDHGAMLGVPNKNNGEQTIDIITQLIKQVQ